MSRLWHTHTRTDGQSKVVQYSVWAESAISCNRSCAVKLTAIHSAGRLRMIQFWSSWGLIFMFGGPCPHHPPEPPFLPSFAEKLQAVDVTMVGSPGTHLICIPMWGKGGGGGQRQFNNNGIIIIITRPKPAYGRQGLDWIVGPGYSYVVFSTNKKPWKTMKPH